MIVRTLTMVRHLLCRSARAMCLLSLKTSGNLCNFFTLHHLVMKGEQKSKTLLIVWTSVLPASMPMLLAFCGTVHEGPLGVALVLTCVIVPLGCWDASAALRYIAECSRLFGRLLQYYIGAVNRLCSKFLWTSAHATSHVQLQASKRSFLVKSHLRQVPQHCQCVALTNALCCFLCIFPSLHLPSCPDIPDVVELWQKEDVSRNLEKLQESTPCCLREPQKYAVHGAERELYYCRRGRKKACTDTHIYRYRSPLVCYSSQLFDIQVCMFSELSCVLKLMVMYRTVRSNDKWGKKFGFHLQYGILPLGNIVAKRYALFFLCA